MIEAMQSKPIQRTAHCVGVIPATSAESNREGRMAKYNINYACGHDAVEQIYGKHKDRESYIQWAEGSKLCPECWAKKQAEERAAENAKAAAANQSASLPALIGSPKQIAWAETIRAKALAASGNQIRHDAEELLAKSPADKQPMMRAVLEAMRSAKSELEQQTSAKWWIEHRMEIYPLEMYVREAGQRAQKQTQEVTREVLHA